MNPLWSLGTVELLGQLRSGGCSAVEVAQSCLRRIEEREPTVRAFVHLDREGALRRAGELDREGFSGPLHGIPVAVKDTVDVAGLRCTLGTPIHGNRVPQRDAEVVRRLRQAGAVVLGTTVSTEYAIARAGPTTNPHNATRTPGGSSSGSAAAVAAGMVPLAVATQTIGSIVRPSTYCGVFGFKPEKGAVSTAGVMPLSPLLDHLGPIARSVADICLAYEAIAGVEVRSSEGKPGKVLRVEGPMQERIEPETREALDRAQALLARHGVPIEAASLPASFAGIVKCWETLLFHDVALNHGKDRDAFGAMMSGRFRQIVDEGRKVSAVAYAAAAAEAQAYRTALHEFLAPNTVILAPATDGAAPPLSEQTGPSYLQGLWSLTGLPALAVPCGKVDGLPVGVQLISRPTQEHFVLQLGKLFESSES